MTALFPDWSSIRSIEDSLHRVNHVVTHAFLRLMSQQQKERADGYSVALKDYALENLSAWRETKRYAEKQAGNSANLLSSLLCLANENRKYLRRLNHTAHHTDGKVRQIQHDHNGECNRSAHCTGSQTESVCTIRRFEDRPVRRNRDIDAIVTHLIDGDAANNIAISAQRVSVNGNGGVGKSYLASMIALDQRVADHFSGGRLWVQLSSDTTESAVDDTLRSAVYNKIVVSSSTASPPSHSDIRFALERRCEEKGAILLVVDDVWKERCLRPIREITADLPHVTVLLTTRLDTVSSYKTYNLSQLSKENGGEMLLNRLLHDPDLKGKLVVNSEDERAAAEYAQTELWGWAILVDLTAAVWAQTAKRMARKSNTVAVVDIMKREKKKRKDVLHDDREGLLHSTVERGLKFLQDAIGEDAPQLFYRLSVFREDEDIPIGVLATLWRRSYKDAQDVCEELERWSLLSDSQLSDDRQSTIHIHDIIHKYVVKSAQRQQMEAQHHTALVDGWSCALQECHEPLSRCWWLYGTLEGAKGDDASQRYYWRNIIRHLRLAGRAKDAHYLLLSYRWIVASLRSLRGMYELFSIFREVIRDRDTREDERTSLRLLRNALELSAAAIETDGIWRIGEQLRGRMLWVIEERGEDDGLKRDVGNLLKEMDVHHEVMEEVKRKGGWWRPLTSGGYTRASDGVWRTISVPEKVSALALSRDGNFIVLYSGGVVQKYDTRNGECIWMESLKSSLCLAVSGDGSFVAVFDWDGCVTRLNASDGTECGQWQMPFSELGRISISAEGHCVCAAAWNTRNGTGVMYGHDFKRQEHIRMLNLSAEDGEELVDVLMSFKANRVIVVQKRGFACYDINWTEKSVTATRWKWNTPRGRIIVSAAADAGLSLVVCTTRDLQEDARDVMMFRGESEEGIVLYSNATAWRVAVDSDGRRCIVTGNWGKDAALLDLTTKQIIVELHRAHIGKWLISTSLVAVATATAVEVCDIDALVHASERRHTANAARSHTSKASLPRRLEDGMHIVASSCADDNRRIAVLYQRAITIWCVEDECVIASVQTEDEVVFGAFSIDGRHILTATTSGAPHESGDERHFNISVWNALTGTAESAITVSIPFCSRRRRTWSSSGNLSFIAVLEEGDDDVYLWSLDDSSSAERIHIASSAPMTSMQMSGDGEVIVVVTRDEKVRALNRNGTAVKEMTFSELNIDAATHVSVVAVSYDGDKVVMWCRGRYVEHYYYCVSFRSGRVMDQRRVLNFGGAAIAQYGAWKGRCVVGGEYGYDVLHLLDEGDDEVSGDSPPLPLSSDDELGCHLLVAASSDLHFLVLGNGDDLHYIEWRSAQ